MSSTASPPKPWERAGAAGLAAPTQSIPSSAMTTPTGTSTSTSTSEPPSLPDRPNTLNSVVNQTASNYSPYGQSRLGTGLGTGLGANPYSAYGGVGGGYGGMNSYSSPYSRFGGMGSSMYGGGYGGMNSMYGGGMYGGGYGMPGQPGQDPSLTQSFNQSTAATFQIIESIVGAFTGFAQMLDSTYMATHSSFFAMVSVAEQFGNLRNTLGSVLGIFTILRWMRTLLAKITGRPPPADATSLTPTNFASFLSGGRSSSSATTLPDGSSPSAPPRPSKKPFIMFAVAVFGLPYLMGKLIRALARSQEAEQLRQQQLHLQQPGSTASGEMTLNPATGLMEPTPLDPRKLDFCRVLYDYTPQQQNPNTPNLDLTVTRGDLVAILSKTDPQGNPSEWWRCRARDGKVGYLPSPYLETLQRRPQQPAQAAIAATAAAESDSRANSLDLAALGNGAAAAAAKGVGSGGKEGDGAVPVGVGAGGGEGFQKSAFHPRWVG